jgi:hypothetical protein
MQPLLRLLRQLRRRRSQRLRMLQPLRPQLRQTHFPSHPTRLQKMRWLMPHCSRPTLRLRPLRPMQCRRSLLRPKLRPKLPLQPLRLLHGRGVTGR